MAHKNGINGHTKSEYRFMNKTPEQKLLALREKVWSAAKRADNAGKPETKGPLAIAVRTIDDAEQQVMKHQRNAHELEHMLNHPKAYRIVLGKNGAKENAGNYHMKFNAALEQAAGKLKEVKKQLESTLSAIVESATKTVNRELENFEKGMSAPAAAPTPRQAEMLENCP